MNETLDIKLLREHKELGDKYKELKKEYLTVCNSLNAVKEELKEMEEYKEEYKQELKCINGEKVFVEDAITEYCFWCKNRYEKECTLCRFKPWMK